VSSPTPSEQGPSIVLDDVWVGYRRRDVGVIRGRRGEPRWGLHGVSFDVAPGECVGVIGANGAGKTTLLQTIAGVLRPTRGTLTTRGRIASIIELTAGFNRELSGRQNLLLQGVLLGLGRAEIRERYDQIVAFAGLSEEMLASPMRMYSAGMGLRLGFSIVASIEPSVLLVDEVLAVGDEVFQTRCDARVAQMQDAGCAVVLVSHDLDLVAKRSDRAILLDGGRILTIGEPGEVLAEYHERGLHLLDELSEADQRMFAPVARRRRR
jgi:ABC-type polysaccharide/polyol phosphate transport system ATPase subunit